MESTRLTVNNVEEKTKEFLKLHWRTELLESVELPEAWAAYNLKGAVPYGDRQGCYALVEDDQVVYIGLGASRGGGLYSEHGLGARLNSHVLKWDRSIASDIESRVYLPQDRWTNITEIFTYGFPSGYGYLACSLEAYLISKLDPPENVAKTS